VIPWYFQMNVLHLLRKLCRDGDRFVLCIAQILLIPLGVFQQVFARFL